jgi:hypothetical protein
VRVVVWCVGAQDQPAGGAGVAAGAPEACARARLSVTPAAHLLPCAPPLQVNLFGSLPNLFYKSVYITKQVGA